jgi:predicted permease
MDAYMNSVSSGYFQTMGIPLLEGRDFDRRDYVKDSKVCIVNRKFAEHFFGDKSAVGRHLGRGGPRAKLDLEIIGVVENSLYEGPRQEVHREVLIPNYGNAGVTFYVRTAQDSNSMSPVLRAEVTKLASTMPVYGMRTLQATLDRTLTIERLIAMLSLGFGALATLLASIGLYGVMAFVVARRTKEIGVRMALGAKAGSVIWIVMKEVLLLLGIGLAAGVPAAIFLGRFVSAQLYGVKAQDPWVTGLSIILLLFVASLAGLIPARRASRIDPLLALRWE